MTNDPIEIMARSLCVSEDMDPDAVMPFNGGPLWWSLHEQAAKDILIALEAAGYQVVPVEPTEKQEIAGSKAVAASPAFTNHAFAMGAYRAMLQAAKEG